VPKQVLLSNLNFSKKSGESQNDDIIAVSAPFQWKEA
jgi:hypothetical protein